MIPRDIGPKILQYARQYPVVTITGPRQSGKTTLCKMLFPDKPYVSLENIEERNFALTDPKGFLDRFPDGAVLDEVQRTPDLLSDIQVIVDKKQHSGQFILTGSHNFELLNTVSQSLAGRTALAKLLPFSFNEVVLLQTTLRNVDEILYTGFYPRIYDRQLDPTEALSFYTSTYVEKDLRLLTNIQDLARFETFLKLCASRCGQIINLSSLGNDCGLTHNTIKNWLSILEASYIIKLLPPYFNNIGKRLIKSPKLYFVDTGLAAFLLGIQKVEHLAAHPLRGALFENMVIAELLKKRFNEGKTDNLYYLRDSKGHEVDLVLDYGVAIDLLEIKSSKTLTDQLFNGLNYYRKLYPQTGKCFLIYGGDHMRRQHEAQILPWHAISSLQIE